MRNYNPDNERLKHWYLRYLKEAKRQSEASLDAVAKAISRFEAFTRYRAFRVFHIDQAVAFKRGLAEQVSQRTGEPLSKATLYSTLNALRNFFQWLAGQQGFRARLSYSDAEYFNLSETEARIATARRERPVPTLEQIQYVIRTMPSASEIECRDRAVVAFAILTGARDGAIASLKLKHVDLVEGLLEQDAREVRTKASKTFTTWFFPVDDAIRQIVVDWVEFLRKEKVWGHDDPLFPATEVAQDCNRQFTASGLARKHWSTAAPIRKIFKAAFAQAGLRYFHPHSFRKTLAQLGERTALTPEHFKAWSQNLGHEGAMTTFNCYGTVSRHRQAEIMSALRHSQEPAVDKERIRQIVEEVYRAGSRK